MSTLRSLTRLSLIAAQEHLVLTEEHLRALERARECGGNVQYRQPTHRNQ